MKGGVLDNVSLQLDGQKTEEGKGEEKALFIRYATPGRKDTLGKAGSSMSSTKKCIFNNEVSNLSQALPPRKHSHKTRKALLLQSLDYQKTL